MCPWSHEVRKIGLVSLQKRAEGHVGETACLRLLSAKYKEHKSGNKSRSLCSLLNPGLRRLQMESLALIMAVLMVPYSHRSKPLLPVFGFSLLCFAAIGIRLGFVALSKISWLPHPFDIMLLQYTTCQCTLLPKENIFLFDSHTWSWLHFWLLTIQLTTQNQITCTQVLVCL